MELTTDNGQGEDDVYLNTLFDDNAAINIFESGTPFSGTFVPEGLLADVNGEDFSGDWTLSVTDDFTFDGGEILDRGIFGEAEMTQVPLPGAICMLGAVLAGLLRISRRK